MKPSQSPMGEAFKIAIMIGKSEESEKEYDKEEEEEEDSEELPEGVTNPIIKLAPAEADYVESFFDIVEEYGKLADNDNNGIWVGYVSAAKNENKAIGVKCSNCAFWCPEMKGCHIIVEKAEANGICRLAAIGEGLVSGKRK
jgi:hypothetical protein